MCCVRVWLCMVGCDCVWLRERERERECVCVCVRAVRLVVLREAKTH